MPVAGGVALFTLGAILTFALTGSVRGIDLTILGVILMVAGACTLLLPLLGLIRSFLNGKPGPRRQLRSRSGGDKPPARSRQNVIDDQRRFAERRRGTSSLDGERRGTDERHDRQGRDRS
jgi:hypothetical protein